MTAQVVKGKAVIFKKRSKNRQPTIRYEPYPTVVVEPNKSKQQKPLDGDLEDGEIPDKKEGHTNNVGKANRSNDQGVQREQLVTNMRQLTSINELCHSYCRNGIDIQGASCLNIHWFGELPAMIKQARLEHEKRLKEVEAQRKLEEAGGKAKKALQSRPVKPATFIEVKEKDKPSSRRSFGGQTLAKEVEEVLGGAVKGELAMQQDFVPLF
ncbi:hypothetical protein LTR64_006995 [Lithohypha guttulata]|uniref:uncharacterized protein n=1 Tax=Lithohypha guttulata TaxID=1690604 RepID=UPI002DE069A9|nr:hypothetical protein LTR51_004447 [Lithohypha guttulata]